MLIARNISLTVEFCNVLAMYVMHHECELFVHIKAVFDYSLCMSLWSLLTLLYPNFRKQCVFLFTNNPYGLCTKREDKARVIVSPCPSIYQQICCTPGFLVSVHIHAKP